MLPIVTGDPPAVTVNALAGGSMSLRLSSKDIYILAPSLRT